VGTCSTVTPSAAVAAAAVPILLESEASTVSEAVWAGTVMVAVMTTLPAVTVTATRCTLTPAASATFCRKAEVSA